MMAVGLSWVWEYEKKLEKEDVAIQAVHATNIAIKNETSSFVASLAIE